MTTCQEIFTNSWPFPHKTSIIWPIINKECRYIVWRVLSNFEGGAFLFKDSPFLAIYRWPLVVNEEPPVSLHTGGKPAQGWPNNQKRTFSPLQCSESFYNSMVAWKMRQTTRYCSLAVITFLHFLSSVLPLFVSASYWFSIVCSGLFG